MTAPPEGCDRRCLRRGGRGSRERARPPDAGERNRRYEVGLELRSVAAARAVCKPFAVAVYRTHGYDLGAVRGEGDAPLRCRAGQVSPERDHVEGAGRATRVANSYLVSMPSFGI